MDSANFHLDFVTVDVFTDKRYEGNPLAIVHVPRSFSPTQEQKQSIAREFNLSETTFLHEQDPDTEVDTWTVDIFTTTEELPFAGHPTIGTTCHILSRLAQSRNVEEGVIEAKFKLKAGPVGLQYDAARRLARAAIPHNVHIHQKTYSRDEVLKLQPGLAEAISKNQTNVKDQYPIVSIVKGMTFVLIELDNETTLELVTTTGHSVAVDGLDEGWNDTFVGTYFYVRIGSDLGGIRNLRTRMIAGTLEDPATGSAASDLAAYLSLMEGKPGEKLRYRLTQGVEMGRRSEIDIEVVMAEESGIASIFLEGGSVQVMQGRLTI